MKFKVGDKVKFLDENGGGIVSRIISPKMVYVTIDDGFEIPVMAGELLRIEEEAPLDSPKHFFREDFPEAKEHVRIEEGPGQANAMRLSNLPGRGVVESGIYLAFVPEDQKWLITGLLDVYLVNHTGYDILYSIFREQEGNGFEGFDYGSVEGESMVLLESVEREQIEKWGRGIAQVLFHTDSAVQVLHPGNAAFRIKLPRFYKETSYHDSAIIDGKALLVSLIPLSAQPVSGKEDVPEQQKQASEPVQAREVKPESIIDKHKTSPREAVVDLHIDELVEDHASLDPSRILRLQVNYFTQCLESALVNNLSKVTFIHGIGTGVLKTAIKEILKDYPSVEVRDASLQQFGYGALDVIIRGN